MDYNKLSQEDFDAIVTGELTHYAIWHESHLESFIAEYFCFPHMKELFTQLIMRKDGFTTQNKIDIVRSIVNLITISDDKKQAWLQLLIRIESFKKIRNSLAHGLDVTPSPYNGKLVIETISRSGKCTKTEITPETHAKLLDEGEKILRDIQMICQAQ